MKTNRRPITWLTNNELAQELSVTLDAFARHPHSTILAECVRLIRIERTKRRLERRIK